MLNFAENVHYNVTHKKKLTLLAKKIKCDYRVFKIPGQKEVLNILTQVNKFLAELSKITLK